MPIEEGIVYKSTGSWYIIKTKSNNFLECNIKGKLRIEGFKSTNPIAVGDHVLVETNNYKTGIITNLLERKNYIIRKSPNLSKQTHILAANLDQVIVIATLILPETSTEFIDRLLAVAEAYSIPATIVLNKFDLYTPEFSELLLFWKEIYNLTKYKLIETSVKTGFQLNIIKELLSNKITLISGNSGVGKSALINKLIPDADIRIGKLSEYHLSGKHTTTFAEMYELPDGGLIIDSPGIKGFGLYGVDKSEIYHFFPEIFNKAKDCQFHNCIHVNEPNCAVIEAVGKNEIHWCRYKSYLSILDDDKSKYR
jgi:ribosome biogenesis GTPase / thiamine phosphate phosphatase